MSKSGIIGILTGGGDVPGLNPAIRAVTIRAIREGFQVIGIRRGWAGLIDMQRNKDADNSENFIVLTEEMVSRIAHSGGTFLHTSRINPAQVAKEDVPTHLAKEYTDDINDLTDEVLKNLDYLKIDYLVPLGGNDTLNFAVTLYKRGVKVIAIPKTMDNDVPGTDYCIGFSTCVTRTINMANQIRTSAGSHERLLVLEVFGKYTGFTAMLPTLAGAANRCAIPEYVFNIEQLTKLLIEDRQKNLSRYSVVLVSEGASYEGRDQNAESLKYRGIGDEIAAKIKELAPIYNKDKKVNIISQKLGYFVRSGEPDTLDSIVPMAFGNLALELILKGIAGRLIVVKNGRYENAPINIITHSKKIVDVKRFYDTERLRPKYKSFEFQPLLIMIGDVIY